MATQHHTDGGAGRRLVGHVLAGGGPELEGHQVDTERLLRHDVLSGQVRDDEVTDDGDKTGRRGDPRRPGPWRGPGPAGADETGADLADVDRHTVEALGLGPVGRQRRRAAEVLGREADPHQPCLENGAGEARVGRQRPGTCMHGIGAALPGRFDDLGDVGVRARPTQQDGLVAEALLAVEVDGHGARTERLDRPHHTGANEPPVGDEHGLERHGSHTRGVVLVLVALAVALVVGLAAGGTLDQLGGVALRARVVVPLALLSQLVGLIVGGPVYPAGLTVSAGCIAVFLVRNRGVRGTGLVALGLLSNALVVGANGAMPVSAHASGRAGVTTQDLLTGVDPRHELADASTRLPYLGDVVPVRTPIRPEVVSPGDVLIAAGLAQLVILGLLGRQPQLAEAPA